VEKVQSVEYWWLSGKYVVVPFIMQEIIAALHHSLCSVLKGKKNSNLIRLLH
jgi:hypothetical protein